VSLLVRMDERRVTAWVEDGVLGRRQSRGGALLEGVGGQRRSTNLISESRLHKYLSSWFNGTRRVPTKSARSLQRGWSAWGVDGFCGEWSGGRQGVKVE
jgi:hypothetical protein